MPICQSFFRSPDGSMEEIRDGSTGKGSWYGDVSTVLNFSKRLSNGHNQIPREHEQPTGYRRRNTCLLACRLATWHDGSLLTVHVVSGPTRHRIQRLIVLLVFCCAEYLCHFSLALSSTAHHRQGTTPCFFPQADWPSNHTAFLAHQQ